MCCSAWLGSGLGVSSLRRETLTDELLRQQAGGILLEVDAVIFFCQLELALEQKSRLLESDMLVASPAG